MMGSKKVKRCFEVSKPTLSEVAACYIFKCLYLKESIDHLDTCKVPKCTSTSQPCQYDKWQVVNTTCWRRGLEKTPWLYYNLLPPYLTPGLVYWQLSDNNFTSRQDVFNLISFTNQVRFEIKRDESLPISRFTADCWGFTISWARSHAKPRTWSNNTRPSWTGSAGSMPCRNLHATTPLH